MTNAVGYTRLSQDSDTSIDRQKRHIREYADANEFELLRIYDDGEHSSGWDDSREEYQKLRGEVQSGEISAVIVNDKRRLARDFDETMRLVLDLREYDVAAHTYDDGQLDLSDPVKAAVEVLMAASEHEAKKKEIERSIEAVRERMNDPNTDHGRPRFGMQYDETGKRQIPGDDFEVVREVLLIRDRGVSYREIEEKLGVSSSTAQRIVADREWYESRAKLVGPE